MKQGEVDGQVRKGKVSSRYTGKYRGCKCGDSSGGGRSKE